MMASSETNKEEERCCRDREEKEKEKREREGDGVGEKGRERGGEEGRITCKSCQTGVHVVPEDLDQYIANIEHHTNPTPDHAVEDNESLHVSKNSDTTTDILTKLEALHSTAGSPKTKKEETNSTESFRFSAEPTLEDIRRLHYVFGVERGWGKYHQPRNLLLALVGEVGELAELFQWREDAPEGLPGWTVSDREAVSDELSDVLIYLVALANKCHVDLPTAALRKIEKNRLKYPVEQVFGSSKKYTEYQK